MISAGGLSAFGVDHGYNVEKAIKLESGKWVRMRSNTTRTPWDNEPDTHHVRAMTSGKKPGKRKQIGNIVVNANPHAKSYKPGEVEWVHTKRKQRGKGIGGEMFRSAERSSPTGAYHSPTQTSKGKKYAAKTPNSLGSLPKRQRRGIRAGAKNYGQRFRHEIGISRKENPEFATRLDEMRTKYKPALDRAQPLVRRLDRATQPGPLKPAKPRQR